MPQIWQARSAEGFGEYALAILWQWPLDLLYGGLAKLGLGFSIIQKTLAVIPFLLLGSFSIYKFLSSLKISKWATLVAGIFYLANTYIILILDGGQFSIAVAYAIFPLVYLSIVKAAEVSSIKNALTAGVLVSILAIFDIRFVYVLALLIAFNVFFGLQKILTWVKLGVIILLVFVGLHSYWIIPSLLAKAPMLPAGYTQASQVGFLSFASIGHGMLMLQPHWHKNVFGKVSELQLQFFLTPVLVFLAPIVKTRSKRVGFWLLIALVSLFLVKGSNEPLPFLYPWLFDNVPGFSLFRDPTKFFFLTALSFSALLGITIDVLLAKFKRLRVLNLVVIAYLFLLISPVWRGMLTGTFSEPYNKDQFFSIANTLKQDNAFGRILWVPQRPPLGFGSPTHPIIEASRVLQNYPFAIGTIGTYEVFNFLRESDAMGQLLDIYGISYISYPYPDERREELKVDEKEYYHTFLKQLKSLPWIESAIYDYPVALLKTRNHQDHFFTTSNTFWVVGSGRFYSEFPKLELTMADSALVFVEESILKLKDFDENKNARIINFNKTTADIAANFLTNNLIFPASMLDSSPNQSGWWKQDSQNLVHNRAFFQEKYSIDLLDFDYGGGRAIAEGEKSLLIDSDDINSGKVLLIRSLVSGKSGEIKIYQGDKLIGVVKTLVDNPENIEIALTGNSETNTYQSADFHWFRVGELASNEPITIRTLGDINVVNALIVVDQVAWDQTLSKVNDLVKSEKIIDWHALTDSQRAEVLSGANKPEMRYERLGPTHYRVFVDNVSNPFTLVFSEKYDSFWELQENGNKIADPIPTYSFINGFYIERDGVYDVYYSAQKYILPGLAISVITCIIILCIQLRNS